MANALGNRFAVNFEELGVSRMMEFGAIGRLVMVGGAAVGATLTKGWGIDWLPFTTIMALIYTYFCVKGDWQRNAAPVYGLFSRDFLILFAGITLYECLAGFVLIILRGQRGQHEAIIENALEAGIICSGAHMFLRFIFDQIRVLRNRFRGN